MSNTDVNENVSGVVREDMTPAEAVELAADGEINIIESQDGDEVVVIPESSPWVNGLKTALKEEWFDND